MTLDLDFLRKQTLGRCYKFHTPFGERLMTYADFIASGRNLRFVELYLLRIQEAYANTHTEDDVTGKSTTELLHQAENRIKAAINGNDSTRIIATGTGATGAIHKFQEIIGVAIPPLTKERLWSNQKSFTRSLKKEEAIIYEELSERAGVHFMQTRPVVFIGPYEHHSNEVTWRESFAEVIRIRLAKDGTIDLADLEAKVSDPSYDGRMKIGSFSAASNVTGIKTPVYDVSRIMHEHDGIVCFDFAASAPYVEIDMNRDGVSYFDAIFVSPHKFLGGPGSSGLLIFNETIYRRDLPPTCGGGGTVDYVSPHGHEYIANIEEREKAGTPGTLQIIKAALAVEIKNSVGVDTIERIEHTYIERALERFSSSGKIDVLGNLDPGKRISIVSFNIRHGRKKVLHPKFVTRLLNDLFGVQSRAGCSCAGPYGHDLLSIDADLSDRYRKQILAGCNGLKPGWVRVGFHFTLQERDFEFICDAIEYVAEYGHLFLPSYSFDIHSGTWSHIDEEPGEIAHFSLQKAIKCSENFEIEGQECERPQEYAKYFAEARKLAEELKTKQADYQTFNDHEQEDLKFFEFVHLQNK